MSISRSIVFICLCSLLLPPLWGQEEQASPEPVKLSDSRMYEVEAMAPDSAGDVLNIPNVFTPNGDGNNDYVEVDTDGTTVYEFTVFTRTGTRIYHSNSPRIFWDGNSLDGKELKTGIYYYVIEEQGGSTPFNKSGFIYLYR